MSHTNSTANLGLPQFIGSDKPTWLGDVNGAFSAIDSYAGTNDAAVAAAASDATSAISQASAAVSTANNANTTAGNASTAANNAVGVANNAVAIAGVVDTKVGLLADLHTTDRTSIVNAINEVKDAEGDLTQLTTTDKSSLVAAVNEVAQGGASANIRYNDVAHTIEVYDNGAWVTAITNIYPGSYKGAIIYSVSSSTPWPFKILYLTLSISGSNVVYVATDSIQTFNNSGIPNASGYGLEASAVELVGTTMNFTPSNGSNYKSMNVAANNTEADIISNTFPVATSSLTTADGTQKTSSITGDGKIAAFVLA